jgi:hypothetical protein
MRQCDSTFNSEVDPGVRWIGNDSGWAPDPCRATITYDDI